MLHTFFLSFIAVFVALDPIGMLPMYVSMTYGMQKPARRRVVNTSMLVAFAVAVIFIFLGNVIFRYVGINLYDFKVAGGLILLLVSLAEIVGQHESANRASGSTGVVPLAVPLITGPAVLTALILQVSTVGYLIALGSLLANYLLAWGLLRKSDGITRLIGKDGTVVVSKVVALLLAAIAISMMRSGIAEAIVAFRGGAR